MSTNTTTRTSLETKVLGRLPDGLLVDGSWRPAADGSTFTVSDPATGQPLARVADAGASDGVAAVDAAARAADRWADTAPRERAEILRRAYELIMAQREEFALLITMEMGKSLEESRSEVTYGAEFLRWFSEEAVRISGRYGTSPEGSGTILVSHRPVGPCFLITPWNFPLAMATRKVAPALAAGCTVVLKPAESTPLTTQLFASVLLEAGVPAGVLNVLTSSRAAELSGPIIQHPELRKLSFTGSTPVGRQLLAQAAPQVLRTSMELGGNAPFLVFDDADVDSAVEGAMRAKFRNIGQACTAANRFLVHADLADDFAERMAERVRSLRIGRGTEPGVTIGPLIDRKALASNTALVQDAVAGGATVLTGGRALDQPGTFFEPTVLTDVPSTARLLDEEIFGPVAAIVPFADEESAIEIANRSEYGLAAYAYTQDLSRAHRLVRRLAVGMIGLNSGVLSNAAAPFGGVKHSGLGREGGAEGIHEYLETVYAFVASA